MNSYYSDEFVTLYHGRMEDVLPTLGEFDACVTDPPYGETSLAWDRWPDGWPALVAEHTSSMWCFGSMRMFLDRRDQFVGWRLSQDVVWEKHTGTGFQTDRFRRMHDHALHWYRGPWTEVHHAAVRVASGRPNRGRAVLQRAQLAHTGSIGSHTWEDDGTRYQGSVISADTLRGKAIHPTEKPGVLLAPLIEYAVPPGGLILDPFAGSCSTLLTARQLGRRSVGIELHEEYCEKAAERLSVPDLFGGAA